MITPEPPAFELHTSNRLDVLVGALLDRLAETPLPPLEREVLIVQSFGMERWLRLEIARRLGIAGHLEFKFPATFLAGLADRILHSDADGTQNPETRGSRANDERDLLTWRLFGLLGEEARKDSPSPARESPAELYLADDPDQRKRYQLAGRLAGLFVDYPMFRPELMAEWERGEIADRAHVSADHSGPATWQAPLWRRLREPSRADDDVGRFPSQRFSELLTRLETQPPSHEELTAQGLPWRISLFGIGTLPPRIRRRGGS